MQKFLQALVIKFAGVGNVQRTSTGYRQCLISLAGHSTAFIYLPRPGYSRPCILFFVFFFLSLFFREMWGLFLSMLVWPSLSQLLSHVERKPVPNGEKEAPPGRGSKIHHRELREWTDCYTLLSPAGIIAMLFFNDIYCILYTRSLNGTTVASIFSNNFLWPLSAHVHQSLPLHFVTRLLSASLVYSRIHFRFFRFQLRPW